MALQHHSTGPAAIKLFFGPAGRELDLLSAQYLGYEGCTKARTRSLSRLHGHRPSRAAAFALAAMYLGVQRALIARGFVKPPGAAGDRTRPCVSSS